MCQHQKKNILSFYYSLLKSFINIIESIIYSLLYYITKFLFCQVILEKNKKIFFLSLKKYLLQHLFNFSLGFCYNIIYFLTVKGGCFSAPPFTLWLCKCQSVLFKYIVYHILIFLLFDIASFVCFLFGLSATLYHATLNTAESCCWYRCIATTVIKLYRRYADVVASRLVLVRCIAYTA